MQGGCKRSLSEEEEKEVCLLVGLKHPHYVVDSVHRFPAQTNKHYNNTGLRLLLGKDGTFHPKYAESTMHDTQGKLVWVIHKDGKHAEVITVYLERVSRHIRQHGPLDKTQIKTICNATGLSEKQLKRWLMNNKNNR